MSALIFLGKSGFEDGDLMLPALQKQFPDATDLIVGGDGKDPLFLFLFRGVLINIMCIDAPAPIVATDPEFANAWFWPEAWEVLSKHRANVIITVAGGDNPRQRAMTLQMAILAVVTSTASAVGVNYPKSGTLLPSTMIIKLLEKADTIATMLFVACYFAREKEKRFIGRLFKKPGILASTRGLSDFNRLDIEVRGFPGSRMELFTWLHLIAADLLEKSQGQYKAGDTITLGRSGTVPVTIEKSMFYDDKVICLRFQ